MRFPGAGTIPPFATGNAAKPVIPSSTRPCASSGRPAGCTIAHAWSSPLSLVKHLGIHWREGEAWFWDTLVDADPASNPANWQWVAGSGADAAPFFRIFNPVLQGQKFDPEGDYVRRYVPELDALPNKHLHQPWKAPEEARSKAGVKLGDTYPHPLVDHRAARERALDAYQSVKNAG